MNVGASPPVVITGFMCAGKTTAARELARLIGGPVIDLDESVAEAEGRTPRELIEEEGEAYFREAEARALRHALERGAARIVALGGGAWIVPENREMIGRRGSRTVWLDAPFELCWQRIEAESAKAGRPLARDIETARALYQARRGLYALAEHRVEVTAGRTAESVAAEIANLLGGRQHSGRRRNGTGGQ